MQGVGPGTVLNGRYALRNRLAQSPSIERWTADDTTLGRPVTVLCVSGIHPNASAALDAARRASAVDDPRLLRVHDVGQTEGHTPVSFVVEESLGEARSLTELLGNGGLPAELVRRIVGESATGLEAARQRGLHHLHLTPASVWVAPDGAVHLQGVATLAALSGADTLNSAVASRMDTVGLLACAYAGLTGRWPLDSRVSGLSPAPKVVGGVPAPSELVAGVPGDLDALCRLTLSRNAGPITPGDLASQIAPWGAVRLPAATDLPPAETPAETPAGASDAPAAGSGATAGPDGGSADPEPRDAGPAAGDAAAGGSAGGAPPTTAAPVAPAEGPDLDATISIPRVSASSASSGSAPGSAAAAAASTAVATAPVQVGSPVPPIPVAGVAGVALAAEAAGTPASQVEDPTPNPFPVPTLSAPVADPVDDAATAEAAPEADVAPEADPSATATAAGSSPATRPVPVDTTTAAGHGEPTTAIAPGDVDETTTDKTTTDGPDTDGPDTEDDDEVPERPDPLTEIPALMAGAGQAISGAASTAAASTAAAASAAATKVGALARTVRDRVETARDDRATQREQAREQASQDAADPGRRTGGVLVGSGAAASTSSRSTTVTELEPPLPLLPASTAYTPSRQQTGVVLSVMAVFVVVVAAFGWWGVSKIGSNTGDLFGFGTPALPEVTVTAPTQTVGPNGSDLGSAVDLVSATGFDPQGDNSENNDTAARVIDGDPATGWQSEGYSSANFGNLKDGVGVAIDLGGDRTPTLVTLSLPRASSGTLYLGPKAEVGGGAKPIGTWTKKNGVVRITTAGNVSGRFLTIWFTEPSSDGRGRYRATLGEVAVTAR